MIFILTQGLGVIILCKGFHGVYNDHTFGRNNIIHTITKYFNLHQIYERIVCLDMKTSCGNRLN